MKKEMNKKAVSEIVSTVLIIMIAVAAVGIIGAIIAPMVRDSLEVGNICNQAIGDLYIDTSSGFSCIDVDNKLIAVQVARGSSEIEYSGAMFFVFSQGNSYPFQLNSSFSRSKETFYLNISDFDSIERVELAPRILRGDSERICDHSSSVVLTPCNLRRVEEISVSQIVQPRGSARFNEGSIPEEESSLFYLHVNGITIMCPNAEVGDTGEIGGVNYTKRTRDQINTTNANTTCTSGINNMSWMFFGANSFNQDISSWDVSSVTGMNNMFQDTFNFNQDISSWDVSSVTNMRMMFRNTNNFNQNLSNWCVSQITSSPGGFDHKAENWTLPRPVWGTCPE